jgi:transposase
MLFDRPAETAAIRSQLGAIFVSLELSRSTWLMTCVSPGTGEKQSKYAIEAGDAPALLARLAELRRKTLAQTGTRYPIIAIQEAGLDGFWLHRVLQAEGCESHVVDAASIAAPRRRRRAKTDRLDGEALVRTLLAYKRGEPRVCSMVRPPTPEAEDDRRICRERADLVEERIRHVNRIKGLLFSQGVRDYEPLRRDRRQRLAALRGGDGRPLGPRLRAQIGRELDRLELLLAQIAAVEGERDALLAALADRPGPARPEARASRAAAAPGAPAPSPVALLMSLKGIGPEFAAVLWTEGLSRSFANRRQAAAYAGLTPTPWRSGTIAHEQGVSKSGNPRLRTKMLQAAWLWLAHQPQSALARWFHQRLPGMAGKAARKRLIVALARKLFVALWKFTSAGIVVEGAVVKPAA